MSVPFVFELGCEELPASHCQSILTQLNNNALGENAAKHNIRFDRLRLFITPRRIALLADNAEPAQKLLEVKGPLYEAAFENGKPNTIGVKFAQAHGTTPDKLTIKEQNGKKFIFVSKNLSTQFVPDVQGFITDLLKLVSVERPMRWDDSGLKFSRPIRWILCMHGKRVLPVEIGSIRAGNVTYGPRFLGSKIFGIPQAGSYEDIMAKNHIIVDHRKRYTLIKKILDTLEHAQGLVCPCLLEDLINEVTFLVEYPHPMICRFNKQFLSLPEEVISTVLYKHQRYFPLYDTNKKIMSNMFLVVANYDKESQLISQGNEMVVNARLRDAVFFYEQDMMSSLKDFAEKTKSITFQEKLGSMYEKAQRVGKIGEKIASELGLKTDNLHTTASIMKADLASAMVIEFPSLEGKMGALYAENEGVKPQIVQAIRDHYEPRSPQDPLPSSELGIVLALADRIDTIYSMFGIQAIPKGNSDPYGLRRAAIAIIRILWEKDLPISLSTLIEDASIVSSVKADASALTEFILQRIEQNIKDANYSHIPSDTNTIRSVIYNTDLSIMQKKKQLREIAAKKNTANRNSVEELAKRIHNIAVKNSSYSILAIKKSTLNQSEKGFYESIRTLEKKDHLGLEDLATFVQPGKAFFDNNMIMSDDDAERKRRLSILLLAHAQIERVIKIEHLLA